MGVSYDIITKDHNKVCKDDICFGAMNCFPWSGQNVNPNTRQNTEATRGVVDRMTTADMKIIQYLPSGMFKGAYWSHPEGKPTRDVVQNEGESNPEALARARKRYFSEMKAIVEDMPILKNILTIHPVLDVCRAHIKDHPADKVILSVFLMRNLAQYDYIHTYNLLRSNGYRPRVAAIFSQFFRYQKGNGITRDAITVYQQSESSWIRCELFGKNAAIRLLKQEDDSFWIQHPWVEQSCGYMRDSHLSRADQVFDSALCNRLHKRTLNSAVCIPGDVAIPLGGRPEERYSDRGFQYNEGLDFNVDHVFSVIDALCAEAGIEGKLDV